MTDKLSEYGLFDKKNTFIPLESESAIFEFLQWKKYITFEGL